MIIELFNMLSADKHYNQSVEIEILKGYFNKPKTFKERLNKLIRKFKFNKNGKRTT